MDRDGTQDTQPSFVAARRPKVMDGCLYADLCVIGAGTGGLSVAAGAAQMGAAVVLVEQGKMGGECLNTGCVPSKALIASAHSAQAMRTARRFGLKECNPVVEFRDVRHHVHGVIAALAPHDSAQRFEGLGVRVIHDVARFAGRDLVQAGSQSIKARRFVIATGSSAAVPSIHGLAEVPYLTNESIFDLTQRPDHLIVIGGGPVGIEIAQAFRRLGSRVTILEQLSILPKDEREAVAVVRSALETEGIVIQESVHIGSVVQTEKGIDVHLKTLTCPLSVVTGSHVLVAAGRTPNTVNLALSAAGIAATPQGITVDRRLRTTNKRVFALGDVIGGPRFTHAANYQAGIVIRNALFGLPAAVNYTALPWVTYCDPELAHVGLTEDQARRAGHQVYTVTGRLKDNDRAQTEHAIDGIAKIVLGKGGRILGATIVGPHAGESISLWGLAISRRASIGAVASLIFPYPTISEISKQMAASYYAPMLFGPRVRTLVGLVQRFLP